MLQEMLLAHSDDGNIEIDHEEQLLEDFLFGENTPEKLWKNDDLFTIDIGDNTLQPVAAWNDEDNIMVNIKSSKRLLKLRADHDELELDSKHYEQRLRTQFEKLNPTPQWSLALNSDHQSNGFMQSDSPLISKNLVKIINTDKFEMMRLKDLNLSARSKVNLYFNHYSVLSNQFNSIPILR
jgi:hypothetical protein